jgi:ferritin-like metal-binding protein YciE
MTKAEQKITQYLDEAHSMEVALVNELQAQIAMTPRGSYRNALEDHLDETREHAERVAKRLKELGYGSNPIQLAGSAAQKIIGQALSLGKAPLSLVRGSGGEEKILKNAKDACATEALEIATYLAIERLARDLGDEKTAKLAASIRADEERMLKRVHEELPALADAVVRAEIDGQPSYDVAKTGAADAARKTAREAKGAVRKAVDPPIANYDNLTADEITAKLPQVSQVDLAKVEAYERTHDNRTTVLDRIASLRGNEPWPGYDEQTVDEIVSALRDSDDDKSRQVRDYERAHKNRTSVLKATERSLASVS